MVRTDYFGDHEFDVLLELIVPFDAAYPEIQIHVDRLLFELSLQQEAAIAGAMPEGTNLGIFSDFDTFREHAAKARAQRGEVHLHGKPEIYILLSPLFGITTRIALQFPSISEHSDRLAYELSKAIDERSFANTTFEEFHQEHRLMRFIVHSKARGQG